MFTRGLRMLSLLLMTLLLTSCAGALTWMAYRSDPRGPQTAGIAELPGLGAPVEVLRDKWAIPHIFAQNETDLMRAIGYVHAQDRLFEMDLFRRIITGRLAEIVGDRPLDTGLAFGAKTTREQDLGMRILGFAQTAEMYVELADPEQLAMLRAYADGVNAYLAEYRDDLPVEFGLIGYQPELWKPTDTIALQRMLGWMLSTNARLELMRAAGDQLIGFKRTEELLPIYRHDWAPRILPNYRFPLKKPSLPFDPTPVKPLRPADLSLETIMALLLPQGAENTDASNNWAVGGSRTVSGKPILSNDPHLPHLAPGIFHLAHLSGGGYDVIGATFPGVPMVILGHNRHVAWAATNNQGDVQDFYLHKLDPGRPERYLVGDSWEDFVTRDEIVYIKEGATKRPETIQVRVSRFGPVVTDLMATDRTREVISLRWSGMDIMGHPDAYWELYNAKTPEQRRAVADRYWSDRRGDDMAVYRNINRDVKTCTEYYAAMARFGTPRQNWVCADTAGHIGYAAAGLVPVRNTGDGRRINRAWQNEGRWTAFVPFKEIPQRMDPKNDFFVSANNATTDLSAYPYPWAYQYVGGYRAARIIEMIESQPEIDAAYISRMQADVHSKSAEQFVPLFVEAAKRDAALTDARIVLERWDRQAAPDSPGAALFYVAMDQLTRELLLDDLGPDLFSAFTHTHLTNGIAAALARDKHSVFHDAAGSKVVDEWDLTYRRALSAAFAKLQRDLGPDATLWRWGDVHTLTLSHALGGEAALATSVNIGPFPIGGASDTVWASFFNLGSGDFATNAGPAYRHIVDMADPARSWLVLDSGNWGWPLTEHYDDMNKMWRQNELARGLMDRADIEENILGVLVLEPAKLP